MHLSRSVLSTLALGLLALALNACGLEAALEACADCGEVRSIESRVVHRIGLYTSARQAYVASDAGGAAQLIVFHVRVRMDRGGARDFTLQRADLQVGDRVEILRGEPIVRDAAARYRWQ